MDKDRRLAFLILKDIDKQKAWSNLSIKGYIAGGNADEPPFIRELVYGVLRNQLLLDYNIDCFLKKPGTGISERILLRMGFYQLSMMKGVAEHAAVAETVKLADAFVKGKKGFINAVLRNFQRCGAELNTPSRQEDNIMHLSVKYSAHPSIVRLWTEEYGEEQAEELLRISNTVPPLSIRINSLKAKEGYAPESMSADSEDFRSGMFSIQDEASQEAVRILAPRPGELMMDMCAAPGGKSCYAAELMHNTGKLLAFDLYGTRAALIRKEAERLGISIISSARHDASVFMPEYAGAADCVLCDVPCSGLGVLRRKPEIKLRDASCAVSVLPKLQLRILEVSAGYVKPGGRLMYSTCTLNNAENEAVTGNFINRYPDLTVETEKTLLPQEGGHDGFYICLMRKKIDKRRF